VPTSAHSAFRPNTIQNDRVRAASCNVSSGPAGRAATAPDEPPSITWPTSSGRLRNTNSSSGSITPQTARPRTTNAARHPKAPISHRFRAGTTATAAAMPTCRMPSTVPRRRSNQKTRVLLLNSDSAPGPSIRRRKKATNTDTGPLAAAATRHAPPSRHTVTTSARRSPCRSIIRPTSISGRAASRVPSMYAPVSWLWLSPRSARSDGLNAAMAYVWPGDGAITPATATGSITHP